jgi:hypothetical protein
MDRPRPQDDFGVRSPLAPARHASDPFRRGWPASMVERRAKAGRFDEERRARLRRRCVPQVCSHPFRRQDGRGALQCPRQGVGRAASR